jgi:hypothetical protein
MYFAESRRSPARSLLSWIALVISPPSAVCNGLRLISTGIHDRFYMVQIVLDSHRPRPADRERSDFNVRDAGRRNDPAQYFNFVAQQLSPLIAEQISPFERSPGKSCRTTSKLALDGPDVHTRGSPASISTHSRLMLAKCGFATSNPR